MLNLALKPKPANSKAERVCTVKTFEGGQGLLNNFGFTISIGGIECVIGVSSQGNMEGYSNIFTPLKKGKLPELIMALDWTTLIKMM